MDEPAPDDLGERATRLWDGIVSTWELRIDELMVLEDACREINLIDRMETQQRGDLLIAYGSQGQPVAAPLIAELRQHRAMFANLMKQLKLPDSDPGRVAETNSEKARAAANARWKTA